nr:MAG TPA: hypothetical protein [Caudoviricetes sp.]
MPVYTFTDRFDSYYLSSLALIAFNAFFVFKRGILYGSRINTSR